jgi:hypothetical protein
MTLAFRIVVPWFSATVEHGGDGENVVWISSAPRGHIVEVTVFICSPANPADDWPGKKAMKTQPVGTFVLPNGDRLWIVHCTDKMTGALPTQGNARFFNGVDREAVFEPGLRAVYFGD